MKSECPTCKQWHEGPCPFIKSIEYYQDGTIKRIEYVNQLKQPAVQQTELEL